jgi:hypothetical protein
MVGPGPIGPGDRLDPYKMRDHAHADQIARRSEEERRRRDPNRARIEDEIEELQRQHTHWLFRGPRDPLMRSLYWAMLGGVGLGAIAGIGLVLLGLSASV